MFGASIQNLRVSINRLNERNTVSSGDQVAGHVSFELTKQTKITSITVALSGVAHVHWSTGGGGGGRKRRRYRRVYSAKVEYFNYKGVILQENGGMHLLGRKQFGHCPLESLLSFFFFPCSKPIHLESGHLQTLA
uniref:Arrestin-like N-terminal domain-containing protein n=1 Tax=Stegastes partitus TaxID=144197 RepID=A0A3B5BK00_9TELE